MGIDPDNTPDHLTLDDIGMESMFAVELQQELERQWNMKLSLNNVKNITVKMLKDYDSGKMDNLKNFIDEAKRGRTEILKYKFLIPTESHINLNGVKKGKPIYLMPPMEITFSAYEEFAKKFYRPVIGLNWTRDLTDMSTLKDITKYFSELLTKLSPNGNYDIVGYFDGALIASKLLRKANIERAVIIDILSDVRFNDEVLSEDVLLEIILQFIAKDLPQSLRERILKSVKSESDSNARIRRIIFELKDFTGKGLIANDLEEILHLMIKRAQTLLDYRKSKNNKISNLKLNIGKKWLKKSGKLIVIKPFLFDKVVNIDEFMQNTRNIYYLPKANVSRIQNYNYFFFSI